MRQLQVWGIIKEICNTISDWDKDTFKKEIEKPEMTFAKYLPKGGNWNESEKYTISIKITKPSSDQV